MKMSKGFKTFLAVILSISFIQISAPVSFGENLSDADQIIKEGIVLYIGSNVSYVNNVKSNIDSGDQNILPIIKNERTIVPIRFIAEKMGMDVTWDEATQTANLVKGNKTIKLTVNNKKMLVNNSGINLDVAPEIISDRMFVPLRAVVEAMDKKVFWDRGLIIISDAEKKIDTVKQKGAIDAIIAKVNVLPTVDTYANLKSLLAKVETNQNRYMLYDTVNTGMMKSTTTAAPPQASGAAAESTADYSQTNVQVAGVDEGDVVKNDGEYIYQVNGQKVAIIKAYPADDMKVVSKLEFNDKNFTPQEMYVDSKNLVVIGNSYKEIPVTEEEGVQPETKVQSSAKMSIMPMPPYYPHYSSKNITKAIIFDITDRANLKQLREIEVEGSYVSSRKIGSSLYFVTNKYVNVYSIQEDEITPCYRDTSVKDDYVNVDYKCIHYFPGFVSANYMMVAGVNLGENNPVNVYTYLGAGNNIYASTDNLFVASQKYSYETVKTSSTDKGIIADYIGQISKTTTDIYKFGLDKGNITYGGKGEVPGTILNQFSMDENNGYFRIATTVGDVWRTDQYTSKNNVYVLDKTLSVVGKIEDIAPGEKIYSTRFMGDRLYMVTFKKVDPLFVIDLKDAANPQILGKLKIPGYSDYLHPYDETHIIGFGKDAIDQKNNNFGWYQGMKIAMFDVTDVNNPIEMFKENIGDRGTESELLNDHKALMFSKEKNLMALPVKLMTIKDENKIDENGYPKYGTFEYQGAYIYNVDLTSGFKLKGRITHISDEEYKKAGSYWYNYYDNVERIVYINNVLYTLSKGTIKANYMDSLKELKSVTIEESKNDNGGGGDIRIMY